MSLIVPSWLGIPGADGGDGFVISWGPMHQGDTAQPITEISNKVGHADRSVQVEGSFGGASVAITGSNDAVNFRTLNDPSITPLVFNAPGLRAVLEASRQIAPLLVGGDGTTALMVSLLLRRLR